MNRGGVFLILVFALLIVGSGTMKIFLMGNIACPADVKICEDGSGVGRDSTNNCEFRACPGEERSIFRDYWTLSLILLAILGIIDSVYLAWKHYSKKPLKCFMGNKDCSKITESRWAKIFWIRNDKLGVIYYLIMLIGVIGIFMGYGLFNYLLFISGGALLFSLFLVYVQKFILKDYCFYCLISSLINLLIFIVLMIR